MSWKLKFSEETCNKKNSMIKKNWQKGTVVIITFLVLVILLLLGSYFLTFVLTETRISKSQVAGAKTYYLAEAGINEAIWKLKNDLKEDFVRCVNYLEADCGEETCQDWSATFFRTFSDGSRYDVSIQNSACGRGEIISTATLPLPDEKTTQRVIKILIFKALGNLTEDSAVFTGGSSENVEITSSQITIYDGNLYCGNILDIKKDSIVEVCDNPATEDDPETEEIIENLEGQVLVASNLSIKSSILTAEAVCADNFCDDEKCALAGTACPPEDMGGLPVVDFFSDYPECNPPLNSFKCRAQALSSVYSASDFKDLLEGVDPGETLILNNEITYVTGDINLKGGRNLIINGVLVADGNIDIGEKGELSQIIIDQPLDSPSGLLAQKKIDFSYTSFDITGVIYALEAITIGNAQGTFYIQGGIMARKVNFGSIGQLNITLDNDIISYGLGYLIDGEVVIPNPEFSPIITIDHWEESY